MALTFFGAKRNFISGEVRNNFKKFENAIRKVGDISGTSIPFVVVKGNGAFNGTVIDGKRMYIGADQFNNGKWAETLVHELTHFEEGTREYYEMQENLLSDRALFEGAQLDVLGKGYGYSFDELNRIVSKRNSGEAITSNEAELLNSYMSEVTAHANEAILGNEAFIDRLCNSDASLFKKLYDRVFGMRTALADSDASPETIKKLRRAEKLYLKAAEASGNARLIAYIRDRSEEGGPHYSLKDSLYQLESYTDAEIESIQTTKLFKVAQSYEEVREFIRKAASYTAERRLFLGKISDSFAERIEKATGISANGKSIALSSSDIGHIFKNHGITEAEMTRGQVPVTYDNIEDVIETLIAPDEIERSDDGDIVGVMFRKNINGRVSAVTIVSNKKKTLTLKSAWIQKEKQSTSPSTDADASASTPETERRMKTASERSISQNPQNVNESDENSFENDFQGTNTGIQASLKKVEKSPYSLESYTEREYNSFGWVRYNDIVPSGAWTDFNSKFAELKSGRAHFYKTPTGDYIIPVNDGTPEGFGIDNMLIYAKGSLSLPIISKVVIINLYDETELYETRRIIYESKGIVEENFFNGILEIDNARAFPYLRAKREASRQDSSADRRNELGGGASREVGGIQPSLKSFNDNHRRRITEGLHRKNIADLSHKKVYSKRETEGIVDSLIDTRLIFGKGFYGTMEAQDRAALVEALWKGLNTKAPGERGGLALDVADYIIECSKERKDNSAKVKASFVKVA